VLDGPMPSANSSTSSVPSTYELPPQEWDRMAALANHLAERDAISPLKRRMTTFLEEANRASLIEQ
jgi:hypothetical protein